ncbi:MAG: ABC transporter ATP-binding protein [Rhodospirillales bacterium]|nr:ABC transporter ATP-binding protein [Rhodospirillales bacterium]
MTLEFRNVAKHVGAETHIHECSFSLAPDGFNVLLGATNAGKTTLIKMMAHLDRPSSGEIWFNGENVTHVRTQKRNVSLVHQFFVNYPHMSVFENIASPLRVAGVPKAEIKRRVQETAALLKLEPFLSRRPAELSGGQQQRTALARALVKDSDLVLLDEPLVNLDYKLREELREELPRLLRGRNALVVYATSEPSEALMLVGRTVALHEGRVTQVGDTAKVYRQPTNLVTSRAFSDPPINTARVTKRGDRIKLSADIAWTAHGPIETAADGDYIVAIRPHYISPIASDGVVTEITGRVLITELSGSESTAHFAFGENVWVSLSHGVHSYSIGESHTFHMATAGCLYFMPDGTRLAA